MVPRQTSQHPDNRSEDAVSKQTMQQREDEPVPDGLSALGQLMARLLAILIGSSASRQC